MKTQAWFSSFLIVFVATGIMTLLGVIGWLGIERGNLRVLVAAFLIQMAAGVVALYLKMSTQSFFRGIQPLTSSPVGQHHHQSASSAGSPAPHLRARKTLFLLGHML